MHHTALFCKGTFIQLHLKGMVGQQQLRANYLYSSATGIGNELKFLEF
jgi:hypothetical protein